MDWTRESPRDGWAMGLGDKTGKASKKVKGGAVLTFDAEARKKFLTGFRKRKNERRQFARQKIAEQVRNDKLEERKHRREAAKSALNANALSEDEDEDDEAEPAGAEVATYQFGLIVSTFELRLRDCFESSDTCYILQAW